MYFQSQRRLVYERCHTEMKPQYIPASLLSTLAPAETLKVMDQVEDGDLREMVKRLNRDEQLLNAEQVGSRRSSGVIGESSTRMHAYAYTHGRRPTHTWTHIHIHTRAHRDLHNNIRYACTLAHTPFPTLNLTTFRQ